MFQIFECQRTALVYNDFSIQEKEINLAIVILSLKKTLKILFLKEVLC